MTDTLPVTHAQEMAVKASALGVRLTIAACCHDMVLEASDGLRAAIDETVDTLPEVAFSLEALAAHMARLSLERKAALSALEAMTRLLALAAEIIVTATRQNAEHLRSDEASQRLANFCQQADAFIDAANGALDRTS